MEWLDKSDPDSRFFVSGSAARTTGGEFASVVNELLTFVVETILGNRDTWKFDTLFVEINCDTGRIIVSPSTEEGRLSGNLDGCAVTLPRLQDFWCDLDESGVSGAVFSERIHAEVLRIGEVFAAELENHADALLAKSDHLNIQLVVFGSEPGEVVFRRQVTGGDRGNRLS